MHFSVTVPANTPEEDSVFMVSGPFMVYPLEQTGPHIWSLELSVVDMDDPAGRQGSDSRGAAFDERSQQFSYAYTRGQDYFGGELLSDDLPSGEWSTGRTATFASGARQEDTVARWRWFPPDGEEQEKYPATLTDWVPRFEGAEYEAGVFLADIWDDNLSAVTRSTNEAAKRGASATWVLIAPPWDHQELDPLPIISNEDVPVPAYPDEATLREHIREIKADGLKLTMEPQVCCQPTGDTSKRGDEWLMAWMDQYESFLLYHARIAQAEGVEKLLLDWGANFVLPAGDHQELGWLEPRWKEMMANVRSAYEGPIGYSLLAGWDQGNYDPPWPATALEPIQEEFDFWGVHLWQGLASSGDATQGELDAEAEQIFAQMLDPLHATDGKPIVLASIAYGSFNGGTVGDKSVWQVALEAYSPEGETTLVYDGAEQAMAMQAIMRAVAKRPFIVGSYPFLYQYNGQPLSPDYSVRGKPAEGTLAEWYRLALNVD